MTFMMKCLTYLRIGCMAGLVWFSDAACLLAQRSPDLPEGVLLKKAADFSKWKVLYSYTKPEGPEAKAPSPEEARAIVTTKTGNIVHEEFVDLHGRKTETWHAGSMQYRKSAGESIWYKPVAPNEGQSGSSDYAPMPANGYRNWEWVDERSFVGMLPFENVPCLVFVPGGLKAVAEDVMKDPVKIAALPIVAFVNAETRLPFALKVGEVTGRMSFEAPPPAMQTLPLDLIDQIQKGEEGRRNLYQQPTRPF